MVTVPGLYCRLPNISYCIKNRRLAVGSRSGQVGVYDLKQRKTQMINAHQHQVTVLCFSEDGKYLATYSYGESTLKCWLVRTVCECFMRFFIYVHSVFVILLSSCFVMTSNFAINLYRLGCRCLVVSFHKLPSVSTVGLPS